MSQEIQPRPDCPRCFGTGIISAGHTLTGAIAPQVVPCWVCLEAARKASATGR